MGTLEEIIDENHAIVSSSVGPGAYVRASFSSVDKTQLEPGCSVLLHNKAMAIVGILSNDTPMVSVMKVDQAPTESFADIGGLEAQIQVRLLMHHLPFISPLL